MTTADVNFPALLAEFKAFGKRYTRAQLGNPDWVIKEIGRLGYSIYLRHETAERYLEQVKEIGKVDLDSPFVQRNYDQFKADGGLYTYRLLGGVLYPTDDDGHASPFCESLQEIVLVALYSIVKQEAELPK